MVTMLEKTTAPSVPRLILDLIPEEVLGTEPILGFGHSTDVHVVRTMTGNYIVRFQRDTEVAWKYEKEVWCLEQAAAVGVPVARPVAMGKVGDWAYLIQTKIEGVNGSAWKGDARPLWHALGRQASAINSIRTRGTDFGWRIQRDPNSRPNGRITSTIISIMCTAAHLLRPWVSSRPVVSPVSGSVSTSSIRGISSPP